MEINKNKLSLRNGRRITLLSLGLMFVSYLIIQMMLFAAKVLEVFNRGDAIIYLIMGASFILLIIEILPSDFIISWKKYKQIKELEK